ncbi:Protein of unknown function [Propionibacterium freudenreichii subsp. freudenreichii]|uniref:Uncharacterized protein n=1 Tax=Propionibacterium freudenreichii subsp. freudenreichii TaxID=66712 RepID=A0A0B7P0Y1_PROFF|nr:Protein of unknown function [Propionibacterium freudenreichii]CEP27669.1 Protein of unknown function [Propionibacterium freudenreichii subsp. freudenreichii]CEG98212.1 Protein of unknown function [Propionibacterium freudenreichii]CEH03384.1 Protein of unknown function [Propionibacterium freudenreichii]CEH03536.1 Protein of unknown function [Propionibacterium freudenreichii]
MRRDASNGETTRLMM